MVLFHDIQQKIDQVQVLLDTNFEVLNIVNT